MNRRIVIAISFIALIVVGAIVLSSPPARFDGVWGDFGESLFMSCSAVCVTGLAVVDVGREYTPFGCAALVGLVELGCLGLMTCGTFLLVAIGRRLSLSSEFSLMNAYGVTGIRGLKGLIIWVIGSMLFIEAVGAALLCWRLGDGFAGVFFSVMGFCNAGFSLHSDSLAVFADDPWVIMTMAALTILGGIGFLVVYNLCTFKFLHRVSGGRLSLHTRVVLRFTAILLLIAFAAFLAFEWNGALSGFDSTVERIYVAFFHAVTPRTCGFTVVPTGSLQPITRLVYEVLMFIGGAPGSAAAGMKVTTFAVLLYTLVAMCRGESETVIDHRAVRYDIVRESIVIVIALIAFAVMVTAALLVAESGRGIASEALFFEAVSAVTTTGLSVEGTTEALSGIGRAVVMVAMFAGRLGALTVVMMIGDRESNRRVKFPMEELVVG